MHNRYSLGPDDANDQLLTSFQQHSLARGNGVGKEGPLGQTGCEDVFPLLTHNSTSSTRITCSDSFSDPVTDSVKIVLAL